MQYKLFSTNAEWLPVPDNLAVPSALRVSIDEFLSSKLISNIQISSNCLIGGDGAIYEAMNVNGVPMEKATAKQLDVLNTINKPKEGLLHQFRAGLTEVIKNQLARMELEQEGNFSRNLRKSVKFAEEVEASLKTASKNEKGYIVWLHSRKENKKTKAMALLADIRPVMLSPKSLMDKIAAKKERNEAKAREKQRKKQQLKQGQQIVDAPLEEDGSGEDDMEEDATEDLSGDLFTSKSAAIASAAISSRMRSTGGEEFGGTDEVEVDSAVDGMKLTTREKKMYNGAKQIAATANFVFEEREKTSYFKLLASDCDDKPVYTNSKSICKKEDTFYRQRITVDAVLNLLLSDYDVAPKLWTPRIKVELTAETRAIQDFRAQVARAQVEEATVIAKGIVKPGHENSDQAREALARQGLKVAYGSIVQSEVKKRKSNVANNTASNPGNKKPRTTDSAAGFQQAEQHVLATNATPTHNVNNDDGTNFYHLYHLTVYLSFFLLS
jgi:hypothetical protein